VEFSRNGHFLRTAFQRALRALRSFVLPAYQMFSAGLTGFVSPNSRWRDFLQLRSEAYQSFRCAQFRDLPHRARIRERARLDPALS
ncbi:hypothetical protein ACWEQL_37315, partial [Kitasatospora sp. NPDC004240]